MFGRGGGEGGGGGRSGGRRGRCGGGRDLFRERGGGSGGWGEFLGRRNDRAYGAVMREYVDVPDSLLANTKALKPYFDASYEYARGLRVKPSRAKKRR